MSRKLLRILGKPVGGLSVTCIAKLKEYYLDVMTEWLKSRNLKSFGITKVSKRHSLLTLWQNVSVATNMIATTNTSILLNSESSNWSSAW
jgi:hypothetical protein